MTRHTRNVDEKRRSEQNPDREGADVKQSRPLHPEVKDKEPASDPNRDRKGAEVNNISCLAQTCLTSKSPPHNPSKKLRIAAALAVIIAATQAFADDEISRTTIDTGGAMASQSASYSLAATIGQPDAGPMASAAYDLPGGFWFTEPPGDCDATGLVDLFDYEDLSGCLFGPDLNAGPAPCNCLDIDDDGDIDLFDFAEFQVLVET